MAMHRYLLIPIPLAALILSAAMAQETKDLLLEKRFKQAYQDALQTAQEIADEMYRFDALMRIAEALVKVGEIDHALQVFDLAIKSHKLSIRRGVQRIFAMSLKGWRKRGNFTVP